MRRTLRPHLLLPLLALCLAPAPAQALTIDFEQFDLGDGLAEVNGVTSPLGVTFLAAGTAVIVSIGGNKGLQFQKTQGSPDRDAVINLASPALSIEARFATGSNIDAGIVALYDQHLATGTDSLDGFILQGQRFGPGTVFVRPGDFFGPPFDQFVAVEFAQSITIGDEFFDFVMDDIVIEFVPEPAAAALAALLTIGLLLALRPRPAARPALARRRAGRPGSWPAASRLRPDEE